MKRITRLAVACALALAARPAAAYDHNHALYDKVLKQYVKNERVNYAALKAAPQDLNAALDQDAAVAEAEFNAWTKDQQLAFLYNLYNAATLRLILDHYPLASIKDIGNVLKGPWDQPVVRLFGKTTTLGTLEHKIIRVRYAEPRGHFALVCAAKGCPPLRGEAYVADRLNAQLEDQGRAFFANKAKNSIDPATKTVNLSPIFDWFKEDFVKKSGSVVAFVAPYFPNGAGRAITGGDYKIEDTFYDWTLNEAK